ncbi:DUF2057 domain-containing protein [Pseudoalteromonas sp. BDTF-M6]|uniref:DUF2057 domain-containing protein n=1 Tax=Pseudoalteromonas sp. BDTF-M6 TaxID=2796132 RepID=UPI001BAED64B|nr:DUF2057 domain-containing protein [Pseudoalteromonas sp. BDTF-M6]MBS3797109.1 DUF2057 domain-containing protein [Pseudoalteromonas sp. BDTF-M6]
MWKKLSSAAALALLLTPSAYAETVSFASEIIPLQVNDKTISHSIFNTVDELELAPGNYRLKLKYSDLYESGFDDHEVIESEPFWVTLEVAAGQDYEVIFDRADTVAAAKLYAQSPIVRLRAEGQQLEVPMPKAAAPSVVAPSVAAPALAAPTLIPANIAPAPAVSTKSASAVAPASQAGGNVSAAAMLEFWWQQATPAQRQAFLQKVQSQQ